MKEWTCSNNKMDAYCQQIRKLEAKFDGLELLHVLRHDNEVADELAKMGSTRAKKPPGVFLHQLFKPSVDQLTDEQGEDPPEAMPEPVPEAVMTIHPN